MVRCLISQLPFDINDIHSLWSEDLEELAAVFAVEAMTPEESVEYREHLNACLVCRGLVGEFQGVAKLLPDTLAVEPTSTDLKQRILTQARVDVNRTADQVPDRPLSNLLNRLWPVRVSPIPIAAMAVLVMAVLSLAAWNIALEQDVSEQNEALLRHREVIRSILGGGQVYQVSGTDAAPQAVAVLIQSPGREGSVLVVTGLGSLPSGMEYQVWRIADDNSAPVGAGTFRVAGPDTQLVPISTPFSGNESIGVSVEPAGGSPAPTGEIVLFGKL